MKIYLPLVSLVVLTFATSVHSRAIHRLRRSALYYANETACVVDDVAYYNGDPVPSSDPCEECKCRTPGFVCTITECEEKEGCQRIKVPGVCCSYQCGSDGDQEKTTPQEDVKEVPVGTTFIPVSISSEVKEESPKDVPEVKEDEEPKKELSPSDDSKEVKPTPEVVATTKQPDIASNLEPKQDETQDKPEKREESDGVQVNKEPESATSAVVIDPALQEKASTSVEVVPQATKEPEPSPTKQEPDSSDKKLEVVTEGRKEGRSGTAEPQIETTSPPLVDPASKPAEEPEKIPDEKPKQEVQKPSDKVEPTLHHLEGTTLEPSLEEKQELPSELPEDQKLKTTLPPVEPKSPEGKEKREESTTKDVPATEVTVEVEKSKDEESSVVVIPTTPESDKQEGREGEIEVDNEKKEDESTELPKEKQEPQKEKQDPPSKPDESTELPVTAASSDSPIEESKEEKVVTSPKSGPSKRFADWLDYVPRDFQV